MKLFQNHKDTAAALLEVLTGLEAEFDASLSPSNRAMQSLGVDRNGSCRDLYSNEAEELWAKQLTLHAKDPDTMHHLAILHHARAFDAECSNDPTKANTDWESASLYWQEILSNQEFWHNIKKVVGEDYADHVEKIRQALPAKLLKIHLAIAYSPSTTPHRAKYHVKHATEIGYKSEVLNTVRASTYELFTAGLPDEVWGGTETNTELIREACEQILRIVEIDPDCITALQDAFRLQSRLIFLLIRQLEEHEGEESKQQEIRQAIRRERKWLTYLDHFRKQPEMFADDLRENVLIWLLHLGDTEMAMTNPSGAVAIYDNGLVFTKPEDRVYRPLLNRACFAHALLARELAKTNSKAAQIECEIILKHAALSPFIASIVAEVYMETANLTKALAVCETGLNLAPLENKTDAMAEHETGRARLENLQTQFVGLQKFMENIWTQVSKNMFPPEVIPNEARCKEKLREIVHAQKKWSEETPQQIFDTFVKAIGDDPWKYATKRLSQYGGLVEDILSNKKRK